MTTIVHRKHPLPEEIANVLRQYNEREIAATTAQFEFVKLARTSDEERRLKAQLYEDILTSIGVDVQKFKSDWSAIRRRQTERIQQIDFRSLPLSPDLIPVDLEPPAPERSDSSFWWANTQLVTSAPYVAEFQADGIHFKGKRTHDGGSLLQMSYGFRARFELQYDRIPRPGTPPWRSAPNVELFGDLLAWTGSPGIFSGDFWSKCWMVRRQTLFQFLFGPNGPVERVIGEAVQFQEIFNEVDGGRAVSHRLPGFQPMPVVQLNSIFVGSIWAELEVRFDIQLEGDSLHWIHPFDLLARAPQWPLIAV